MTQPQNQEGSISVEQIDGIATITFSHPKSNSLPGPLLNKLAMTIDQCGKDPAVSVIVLRSSGERAFCAGASFDELLSLKDAQGGKAFFMGFAHVVQAMKACPKFIIARVQGKAIGGGVGLVSAADYALAHNSASVKLSELALGLGPFVIGPAVERKIGIGPFSVLSIDNQWRDANWAQTNGLYADLFPDHIALDEAVEKLAKQLTRTNPQAMAELKEVFWEGTDNWAEVLESRAERSGRLALSKFTSEAIAEFGRRLAQK